MDEEYDLGRMLTLVNVHQRQNRGLGNMEQMKKSWGSLLGRTGQRRRTQRETGPRGQQRTFERGENNYY